MTNHNTNHFWRSRSVLVTGATGFLGGWLTTELLRRGASVVALVRDHVPQSMFMAKGLRDQAAVVQGSLDDLHLLSRTIAEYEIESVFHLAAQSIVGVAMKNPIATLETNVAGAWNVLEACRLGGVKQVLVASSDKAYGTQIELPYSEDHPMQGKHPYDVSKSCGDLIATMYSVSYGLPVCITRCANLYGGGDLNFNRLIPGIIRSCLTEQPFIIRSDGKFVRDYLYVEDAASAYIQLAESMAEKPELHGEAFNISAGVRATSMEIVEAVLRAVDQRDLPIQVLNQASHEIREQYLDGSKFRAMTGWTPVYALDSALEKTIGWYRNHRPWASGEPIPTGVTA